MHRGAGFASRLTSAWYEQARDEVAAFVGAREGDSVVFTRTTTDSWALLSKALPSRTTVFVFGTEHHSTLLPWGALPHGAPPRPADRRGRAPPARGGADGPPVAPPPRRRRRASNVTGEVWPVERLAALAHGHGARIAVDAAQLSAHRTIDLAAWDADYVAFSGHKTYAPYGAGVLAGRADWLDAGAPLPARRRRDPVGDRGRHDAGPPARRATRAAAPTSSARSPSPRRARRIARHREAIEEHESRLLDRLRAGLDEVTGVEVLSIFGDDSDRVGVVAFTVEGWDSSLVSQVLSVEHGIGVRDGKFCAHLLVDELLEDPWGERPATAVRASIGLGSTLEGVERLVAAVARLVEHGTDAAWTRTGGGWTRRGHRPARRRGRPSLVIPGVCCRCPASASARQRVGRW